jgi:hypothetical protein
MYLFDLTLALVCIFFGLAIMAPVIKTGNRYERYVLRDGTVIDPEEAGRLLADDPTADIDLEWFMTSWQDKDKLAADGWRLAQSDPQPAYTAMLGFGGMALLAASAALPLSLGQGSPVFAYGAFATAALFAVCGLGRLVAIFPRKLPAHPLNYVHLLVTVLALLAGLRLC